MIPLRATFVPALFEKLYGFGRYLISLWPDRQLIHLFHRKVPDQSPDEMLEMHDLLNRHFFREKKSSLESIYHNYFAQRESRKFSTLNEWMFERSDLETRHILSQFIRQWSYYLGKELVLEDVLILQVDTDSSHRTELCFHLGLGNEAFGVKIQKGIGKARICSLELEGEAHASLELDLFPSTEQVKQRIEKVIAKHHLLDMAYQITAISNCYFSLFELAHVCAVFRDPATLLVGYQVLLTAGEQRFLMNLSASGCHFKLVNLTLPKQTP